MPKILCIDDNSAGLTARRILLEGAGHKVLVAHNGREGLEILHGENPDLVVVDYLMPQMNGGELVRELKRTHPNTPVILLSGYTDSYGLEEKVTAADCVLKKGAREVAELTNAMNRLLRKSRKKPAASVKAASVKPDQKKPARRSAKSPRRQSA